MIHSSIFMFTNFLSLQSRNRILSFTAATIAIILKISLLNYLAILIIEHLHFCILIGCSWLPSGNDVVFDARRCTYQIDSIKLYLDFPFIKNITSRYDTLRPFVLHPILMSIIFEHYKQLDTIQRSVGKEN